MNNVQIENALRGDSTVGRVLVGVFPADCLPGSKEFPGAYVANTVPSNMVGQHWVAFYCENDEVECFDSFGRNPGDYSEYIQKWLDDEYQVVQCENLQSKGSTVCGQYCMFFILLRPYGFSYEDILSALTCDSQINDEFVCKFVNKFFKMKTIVKDKTFLLNSMLKKSR